MLYLCYLCRFKPLRDHLRGFLIAAWAGDKIAEFSFPEISFHFPLRPWFFFVSPAYAGKSHSYLNSTFLNLGSPPCMRGKEGAVLVQLCKDRITPACAGKRLLQSFYDTRGWDHPRMCGEKADTAAACALCWGSPPHVRGKDKNALRFSHYVRITPACAGKRLEKKYKEIENEDHPRMCGEKKAKKCCKKPNQGSPPHVRGKARSTDVCLWNTRITPACAGKRNNGRAMGDGSKDHPRMCGEKSLSVDVCIVF